MEIQHNFKMDVFTNMYKTGGSEEKVEPTATWDNNEIYEKITASHEQLDNEYDQLQINDEDKHFAEKKI